jgi:hypothetical protein
MYKESVHVDLMLDLNVTRLLGPYHVADMSQFEVRDEGYVAPMPYISSAKVT